MKKKSKAAKTSKPSLKVKDLRASRNPRGGTHKIQFLKYNIK